VKVEKSHRNTQFIISNIFVTHNERERSVAEGKRNLNEKKTTQEKQLKAFSEKNTTSQGKTHK
jgi:hypothetical protein